MRTAALSPAAKKALQGLGAGLIGFAVASVLWLPGWSNAGS
jgi:hypothetical protein